MFVIAAVTMSMITILSAFNGIEDLVQDLFGTLDADLAAVPISGEVLPNELGEIIGEYPGVAVYSAVIESEAIIRGNGVTQICSVLGVDAQYGEVSQIARLLKAYGEDHLKIRNVFASDTESVLRWGFGLTRHIHHSCLLAPLSEVKN